MFGRGGGMGRVAVILAVVAVAIAQQDDCPLGTSDLCIIVDASTSLEEAGFESERTFVNALVRDIEARNPNDDVRFAIVVFNTGVVLQTDIVDDGEVVLEALNQYEYKGGWTRTDRALRRCHNILERQAAPDAQWVVVLLSDGIPYDNFEPFPVDVVYNESDSLKDAGALIVSVAAGPERVVEVLQQIATGDNIVSVDNVDQLPEIIDNVVGEVCNVTQSVSCCDGREYEAEDQPNGCDAVPCATCGGSVCPMLGESCTSADSCQRGPFFFDEDTCSCRRCKNTKRKDSERDAGCTDALPACLAPAGAFGDNCGEVTCQSVGTERFCIMVDASRSLTEAGYQTEKDFVQEIIQEIVLVNPLDADIQFGIVFFATNITAQEQLGSAQQALQFLDNFQYTDEFGTYTNRALEECQRLLGTPATNGNTQGIALMVSDGNPFPVELSKVYAVSDELKEEGVTVVAVGAGPELTIEVLENIADPGLTVQVDEVANLSEVVDVTVEVVCSVAANVTCCDGNAYIRGTEPTACAGVPCPDCNVQVCPLLGESCVSADDCRAPVFFDPDTCACRQCKNNRESDQENDVGCPTDASPACLAPEGEFGDSCGAITCSSVGTERFCIMVDASHSLTPPGYESERAYVEELITSIVAVNPEEADIQFAMVFFETNVTAQTRMGTAEEALQYLNDFEYTEEWGTNTHLALEECQKLLAVGDASNNTEGIALLVSDGQPWPVELEVVYAASDVLKEEGVTVVAVGAGPQLSLEVLENIASPGLTVQVDDTGDLADVIDVTLDVVCSVAANVTCCDGESYPRGTEPALCTGVACATCTGGSVCPLLGQVCTAQDDCNAPVFFDPDFCACRKCKNNQVDDEVQDIGCTAAQPACLAQQGDFGDECGTITCSSEGTERFCIMVDASHSLTEPGYNSEAAYVDQVIREIVSVNPADADLEFALVFFDTNITAQTRMGSADEALAYLNDFNYTAEWGTNTHLALEECQALLGAAREEGDADGIALLVSDGQPWPVELDVVYAASDELKAEGATVVAVGAGPQLSLEVLENIASPGLTVKVDNVGDLAEAIDVTVDVVCSVATNTTCCDGNQYPVGEEPAACEAQPCASCTGRVCALLGETCTAAGDCNAMLLFDPDTCTCRECINNRPADEVRDVGCTDTAPACLAAQGEFGDACGTVTCTSEGTERFCIMVDASHSLTPPGYEAEAAFVEAIINEIVDSNPADADLEFALVFFETNITAQAALGSADAALAYLKAFNYTEEWGTNTHLALQECQKLLGAADPDGTNEGIALLVSDGKPWPVELDEVYAASDALKQEGQIVVAVGAGPQLSIEVLENIASPGLTVQVDNVENLSEVIDVTLETVCSVAPSDLAATSAGRRGRAALF